MDELPEDGQHRLLPPPMAKDEALRALSDIRAVIDRTAKYTTFSAMSGFVAGAAAMLGSGFFGLITTWPGTNPLHGSTFLAVWAGVFAVAAVGLSVFTWMKARQRGQRVWTPITCMAFGSMMGPGVCGVLGSAALIHAGAYDLLPGLWLAMYGCGMYVVSYFASNFLRWMGLAFMALGTAAWFSPAGLAPLWLGLGFGGLHVVFGLIVLKRFRG